MIRPIFSRPAPARPRAGVAPNAAMDEYDKISHVGVNV